VISWSHRRRRGRAVPSRVDLNVAVECGSDPAGTRFACRSQSVNTRLPSSSESANAVHVGDNGTASFGRARRPKLPCSIESGAFASSQAKASPCLLAAARNRRVAVSVLAHRRVADSNNPTGPLPRASVLHIQRRAVRTCRIRGLGLAFAKAAMPLSWRVA